MRRFLCLKYRHSSLVIKQYIRHSIQWKIRNQTTKVQKQKCFTNKRTKQEVHPVYSKEGMKSVSLSSYILQFAFFRLPYYNIVDIYYQCPFVRLSDVMSVWFYLFDFFQLLSLILHVHYVQLCNFIILLKF